MSRELQRVSRLYDARAEFKSALLSSRTEAQLRALPNWPNVLYVDCNPELSFRDVWILLLPEADTYNYQVDLVAFYQNTEIYRELVIFHGSTWATITSGFIYSNYTQDTVTNHGANEYVVTRDSTTNVWKIYPRRLNLTCDRIAMQVVKMTTATSPTFTGWLFVRSQNGI